MIKKFIKTLAFFLTGLILFSGVNSILGPNSEDSEMMFKGYYNLEPNTVDAVFVGNSHTYKYWQPAFAWKELGMASMEISTSIMPSYVVKNVVIEALKTQNPKVLVIDATAFAQMNKDDKKFYFVLDNMKFSFNRIDMIENYCRYSGITGMDKLQYYFPIMQFHSRWKELGEEDFYQTHPSYLNSTYQTGFLSHGLDKEKKHPITDERTDIGSGNEAALRDLLEWCKQQQDIEIQFIAPPVLWKKNMGGYNRVGDIIKEYGMDYLNFNDKELYEFFKFEETDDFENINHTNINGSFKFTKVYGQYLMKKFQLDNHQGEDIYESWNQQSEDYYTLIRSYHYFKY
ncbi:hypothetical protein D3Z36_02490 [Lachnospiraceae bacterium]|nr:hypothetical protein [Lachnospiraceae bacterium]